MSRTVGGELGERGVFQPVAESSLPVLQTKAAYVLFYQRRDEEFHTTPSLASVAGPPCSSQLGLMDTD